MGSMTVHGYYSNDNQLFKPMTAFKHLKPTLGDLYKVIDNYVSQKGFKEPSPIQKQCWPPLLSGRDVIGIAATGSGKTLGFLIPALMKLKNSGINNSSKSKYEPIGPKILILAPTRELAMQSLAVIEEVNAAPAVCVYGGVPKNMQKAALRAGAEIVVATPGRLIDLIEENVLTLSKINYLVLDEADRMLDDGFEPAIRKIVGYCPHLSTNLRQTVIFSATWPEEVRKLASNFMREDPLRVVVGSEELTANHRVTQIVECIDQYKRDKRVISLLDKYY